VLVQAGASGVDQVLDSVRGTGLTAAVACLAYRIRCVSIGDTARDGPSPDST